MDKLNRFTIQHMFLGEEHKTRWAQMLCERVLQTTMLVKKHVEN